MSNKGLGGSVRVNSLDKEGTSAMESHELRLDYSGQLRSIEPENEALFYRPYGDDLSISQSYEKHVEGARRNASASKLLRHSFVQFPTNIEVTPESEQMMLREAVAFINKTHGGRAVFHGRIDRDEKGKHGVDVFFAPRYQKKTAKGVTDWISLTKFGKERARDRLGQKQEEKYNKTTKEWEPQFNKDGSDKMIWKDSAYFQGQVLQDEWFEHLRDVVGLDWVLRGEKKVGRDPDRVEVEEYKLKQEREKLVEREVALGEIEAAGAMTERVIENAMSNVKISLDLMNEGNFDTEISAAHPVMKNQPQKFAALKAAAPENRPTEGFRRRFWSLSYSTNAKPLPMSKIIRDSLTKIFDRLDAWATELRNARLEVQNRLTEAQEAQAGADAAQVAAAAATEAATASTAAAELLAAQILDDAREKGYNLALVDTVTAEVTAHRDLIVETLKAKLSPADYREIANSVNGIWASHPKNPKTVKPAAQDSGPSYGS
jgi:hypothetical protein